jgi:hypothetical protein
MYVLIREYVDVYINVLKTYIWSWKIRTYGLKNTVHWQGWTTTNVYGRMLMNKEVGQMEPNGRTLMDIERN